MLEAAQNTMVWKMVFFLIMLAALYGSSALVSRAKLSTTRHAILVQLQGIVAVIITNIIIIHLFRVTEPRIFFWLGELIFFPPAVYYGAKLAHKQTKSAFDPAQAYYLTLYAFLGLFACLITVNALVIYNQTEFINAHIVPLLKWAGVLWGLATVNFIYQWTKQKAQALYISLWAWVWLLVLVLTLLQLFRCQLRFVCVA